MKITFVFLILMISLQVDAQDCNTSLLFKKGAVLTYKNYQVVLKLVKMDFAEKTRLTYTVDDVKDSNNTRYSFITKTGINPTDESKKYEKKYIVTCDGNNLSIPVDFYSMDNVFFSNEFPRSNDKGCYTATTFKGDYKYNLPLDVEKGKFLPPYNQVTTTFKIRRYDQMTNNKGETFAIGHISENSVDLETVTKQYEANGDEMIKTTAGSYKCKKISATNEVKNLPSSASAGIGILYYNPEIGIVKTEARIKNKVMGYMELVSIK